MEIKTVKLIYFSATGTTKKILYAISKGLNVEKPNEVNLTLPESRSRMPDRIEIHEDIAIIGVPVYEERIPQFLNGTLKGISGFTKPVILVSVYGNIGSGIALNEMEALCIQSNMIVVGSASFIGEHSFSSEILSVAKGRPNTKDLEKAEKFGRTIYNNLLETDNINTLQVAIPKGRLPMIAKILPNNSAKIFTKQPVVDRSTCKKCGICVKRCPMNAIDGETLKIEEELCIRCLACVRKCPLLSRKIEYKKKWIVKKFLRNGNKHHKEPIFLFIMAVG